MHCAAPDPAQARALSLGTCRVADQGSPAVPGQKRAGAPAPRRQDRLRHTRPPNRLVITATAAMTAHGTAASPADSDRRPRDAGLVCLRRLGDSQVRRIGIPVTARRPRPQSRARWRELPRRPSAVRRLTSGRPRAGNAAGAGSVSVTVRCGLSLVTYHGWRWLGLSARLCNSKSDDERPAGVV
jgi:hypothetical protein